MYRRVMILDVVAAVDLGGTAMKGALFTAGGKLVGKDACATEAERGYGHVLANIRRLVTALCRKSGIDFGRVKSVGVGVPAFMTAAGRQVVLAPNLGWRDKSFAADLANYLDKPVYCNNDANLAALGEHWQGIGSGIENLLMITIGTGIGSGMIINGELYQGNTGMAVEVGHMVIMAEDGYPCTCGRRGCVETLAAAPAIVREARKLMPQASGAFPGEGINEAKQVYRAAASGDSRAKEVVEKAAYFLGVALANILNFYELPLIIIGGGVSRAGDVLLKPLQEVVATETLFYSQRPAKVVLGQLGNDAGVYGAARWAVIEGERS